MPAEFYARPVLTVRDVSASIRYYCEQLGFTKMWSHPSDIPVIAQVGRNGLEILLDSHSVIPKSSVPAVLSMTLNQKERLGDLHCEFKRRGAKVTAPPFEVVWERNLFQLDVVDLDGNILIFWGAIPEESLL